VAALGKTKTFELKDVTDNLGLTYLVVLFVSGAVWAFIAINNFESPVIFKLSLIYSLLLIFGFLGVSFDRRNHQLGLDSRLWEGGKIKNKLIIAVILFALWYLVFMSSGFSVATAQSVSAGTLFSVSPELNFFLTTVLGPLAENIFFFGVLNMTFIFILRKLLSAKDKNKAKSVITGLVIMAFIPIFSNVPNIIYVLGAAGVLTIVTGLTNVKFLDKHAPIFISALVIGGAVFPKFHSFAYQLNEKSFIAAQIFGIGASLIAGYIGMLPVDIIHVANNAAVAIGV
jgi:hypothetical protein